MKSNEVTQLTPNEVGNKVEIEFLNFDLSEEIRVNNIFRGWNISKAKYKEDYSSFTKIYSR